MTMKNRKTLAAVAAVLIALALVFVAPVSASEGSTTVVVNDLTNLTANLTVGGSVSDGDTLYLESDITASSSIDINSGKTITLNLGGHRIDGSVKDLLKITNGTDITITNGTINSTSWVIVVDGGKLTLGNNILINASNVAKSDAATVVGIIGSSTDVADYSVVTINDGTTLSGRYGVVVKQNETKASDAYVAYGVNLCINSGTFKGHTDKNEDAIGIWTLGNFKVTTGNVPKIAINNVDMKNLSIGIASMGYSDITINNANVNAANAIEIKGGNVTINGGTFTSTGEYVDPAEANGNGSEDTGAALSITSNDGYAQSTNVSISGGLFTSEKGHAVYEGIAYISSESKWASEDSHVKLFSVTGGKFITNNNSLDVVNLVNMSHEMKANVFTGGMFNKELGSDYFASNYKLGYKDGFYVLEKNEVTVTVIDADGVSENTVVQIPVNSKYSFNVEKEGYTCTVYQDAECTQQYPAGGLQLSADTTLYFKLTPITYTIAFNANGGDGVTVTGSMESIKATYDSKITLPALNFSIEGKVFAGWATSSDGDVLYFDTVDVLNLASSADTTVTLYAIWTTIDDVQPGEVTVSTEENGAIKVTTLKDGWNNESSVDENAPVTLTNGTPGSKITMVILFDEYGWTYGEGAFVGNITNVTVTYPTVAASFVNAGTIQQNVSFVLNNVTSVLPKINATYNEEIALAINGTAEDNQIILPLAMITAENADEVNANMTDGNAVTVTFILNKTSFASIAGVSADDITVDIMESMLKGYHYVSETYINTLDVSVSDDTDGNWIVTMSGEHFSSYALALYAEEEVEEDTGNNQQQGSAVIITPSKSNKDVVDPTEDPTEEPTDEPTDVPGGDDLPDIPDVGPTEPSTPAPILAVLAGLGAAVVLRRK